MAYPAVTHHGAIYGITGSCHQLHFSADHSVLIDCGLCQGEDANRSPRLRIDVPIEGIRALLLTHIHLITSAAFLVCWLLAFVVRSFALNLPSATRERVAFSGDLGAAVTPLLRPPLSPEPADILVLGSTYGDRLHDACGTRQQRLERMIDQAMADHGTFSVSGSLRSCCTRLRTPCIASL